MPERCRPRGSFFAVSGSSCVTVWTVGMSPRSTPKEDRLPPTPRRLAELSARERRRGMARTALLVTLAWVLLIGVYYAVPSGRDSAADDVVRLAIGLILVVVVVSWQASHIARAELPELPRRTGTGRDLAAVSGRLRLHLFVFVGYDSDQLQSTARPHSAPFTSRSRSSPRSGSATSLPGPIRPG